MKKFLLSLLCFMHLHMGTFAMEPSSRVPIQEQGESTIYETLKGLWNSYVEHPDDRGGPMNNEPTDSDNGYFAAMLFFIFMYHYK